MEKKHMVTCLLAQLNFTVGRIEENAQKILACIQKAHEKNIDMILFPELALSGYPPEDLLLRQDFLEIIQKNLEYIIKNTPNNILVILGYPEKNQNKLYNSAAVIFNKKL